MGIVSPIYQISGIVLALIVFLSFFPTEHTGITRLNPVHGNALLIQDGASQVLIGGGSDVSVLHALPRHMSWFDRRIEVVMVPSWKAEDITGITPVLDRYDIGVVILPHTNPPNEPAKMLVKYILQHNIPYRFAEAGEQITAGTIHVDLMPIRINIRGTAMPLPQNSDSYEKSMFLVQGKWFMKCYNETDLPFLQHYCIH